MSSIGSLTDRKEKDDTSVSPGASGDGMPRGVEGRQDADGGTDVDIAHFPAERSLPRPGPPTRGRGKRERPARGAGRAEPQ